MAHKSKTGIKDIFDGDSVQAWEDEEWIYLSFPYCVINFPKEIWADIKKDLQQIGEF
jgi:ferredoxin-fold anticodon binding domain-containing protein